MKDVNFKLVFCASKPPKITEKDIGIFRRMKMPKYIMLKGSRQQKIIGINRREEIKK